MGFRPDKNWQKFHHQEDKVAVKAVPAYSEKHLNQNWHKNTASLPHKPSAVEPAVRTMTPIQFLPQNLPIQLKQSRFSFALPPPNYISAISYSSYSGVS
ncbi:hypothetical protein [Serratia sp. UGAL515B_01]|uniref:hypothetical protein n=1 Tax=Serratia sp. UGAL515B_01 TaxID=2986763 RepID=UPI0029536CF8|nr:hypothetical protein [Serratia sp. UGAL515B_01]WON75803.1 hypothetical protein OK023_11005 [Serratia sp. UGAL515B_01]